MKSKRMVYRLYLDTSVFGGCFDDKFNIESNMLFNQLHQKRFKIIVSDMLLKEIQFAPDFIKPLLTELPTDLVEHIETDQEVLSLRDKYIAEKILTIKSINDATHIALATVARADAIVSWNFKHIVNLDKIRLFNKINFLNNYQNLIIISPKEVVYDSEN